MFQRRDNAFLLTLIVLALFKAGLTRWLIFGSDNPVTAIALELFAVVALLCIVDAIPFRRRPLITLSAYAGFVFLMYANLLYASYFDQLVEPSTLLVANQIGSVLDIVVGLFRPIHLLYVADMTFMVVWAIRLSDRTLEPAYRSGAVTAFGVLGMLALMVQIGVVATFPSSVDSFSLAQARGLGAYQVASLFVDKSAANASVLPVIPASTKGDSGKAESPGRVVQRRIDALRQGQYGPRVGGVKRAGYRGANVYVIQVESFQAMAQGTTINGKQITPHMNAMADESWLFTNAFAQTGAGNTADAEFTINTSLMTPARTPASVAYVDRELPSLPRVLGDAGYKSITMHANDAGFWNRRELYAALGFDSYYEKRDFGTRDIMYRGASDEVFLSLAERYLEDALREEKPLYVNLVTMTSHAPFDYVPDERQPLQLPGDWENVRAGRFLRAMSYTDAAVGRFISWLKESGQWDTSIVILCGDHTALKDLELKGDNKVIVEELLGRPYSKVDRQRVAMMIHLPGQTQGGVVSSVVGQVDIAPTIADLLGVDLSEMPHLGRSMFVDADPLVITRAYFTAGSFINGSVLFEPKMSFDDGRALDVASGQEMVPGARERDDFKRAAELSALSDEWIRSLPPRANVGDIKDAFIPEVKMVSD